MPGKEDGPVQGPDRRAFVLASGTFAVGTDAFIIGGILPEISQDLHVSIASAGLVISVFSFSYAIGSPLLTALVSHWNRRPLLVGSLAVFALANLLSAVSPGLGSLLATRVLAACAAGIFSPAAYSLANELGAAGYRGRTLAVVVAGFSSATVLGVPVGVLIGQRTSWRGALVAVAVIGAIAAAATFLMKVPSGVTQKRSTLAQRLAVLLDPKALAVLAPFLFWSAGNFMLYGFVAAVLGTRLSTSWISPLLFVFGVGGVLGNLSGGALFDRFGRRWPTALGLAALVAALASMRLPVHLPVIAGPLMLIWAICMATLYTLQQQRALTVCRGEANLMLSLNNSTMYLGASLGVAAGSIVIARLSIPAIPSVSAACAGIALVLLCSLRVSGR